MHNWYETETVLNNATCDCVFSIHITLLKYSETYNIYYFIAKVFYRSVKSAMFCYIEQSK